MQFFDAWRIRPSLLPDPKMGEKLPSLGTEELIPEEPPNADYGQTDRADVQHRREQERDARGAAKTIAQLALEMSHVHRLAALITEKADLFKELAMRRKSYQDEIREGSKGKAAASSAAPKKQKPPMYLPAQPHRNPLLRPPLMAVRLWRLMRKAAHLNPQELRSPIRSHRLLYRVEPRPFPRNLCPHLCQSHRLDTKIKMLRLRKRVSSLPLPQSHLHSVMKY